MPPADDADLPTGFGLTGLDATFRKDPHKILDRLRAKAPIHHDHELDFIYMTKHADVRTLLSDKTLSRDPMKTPEGSIMRLRAPPRIISGEVAPNMMWMDDPEHKRQRGLVAKAFTPRAVDAMRPSIAQIVEEHLDAIEKQGAFDGMNDYAVPIPIYVIGDMMGLPRADMRDFYTWTRGLGLALNVFRSPEESEHLKQCEDNLDAYMRDAIGKRRVGGREDLITALTRAEDNGERLNDDEITSIIAVILIAGNITTADMIGNGIVTFIRHRNELDKALKDRSLVPALIEELLRFEPPVAATMRHATHEGTAYGCPVKPGTGFVASLMAANRDPDVFEAPHEFRIDRGPNDHCSFGGGVHFCMGAPLAKLEGGIALMRLFERFPNLHLTEPVPDQKPSPAFRSYESLPLAI